MQRPQRFEPGEDPKRAVEFAAGRLGVEMRADRDRGQVGIFARSPREHVAHLIDGHGAAKRGTLRLKPIADLPIEIGQRETANAAFCGGADLRGLHQRVPQPLGIDLQKLHVQNSIRRGGETP